MSSRFLREWHILGDMSLVGRRKAHVPRGCHCHLFLPASCYLCPCLCPGPELLLGPAPLPWPRQLSNVFLWPSPPPCLSRIPLDYPHTPLPGSAPCLPSQMPSQVPYVLASLCRATEHPSHTFTTGPGAQGMLALGASYQTATITITIVIAVPPRPGQHSLWPFPGPGVANAK